MDVKQKRKKMFASYTEPLRAACKAVEPLRILEWGPGPSTILMAEECPEASILTIEHDEKWVKKWTEAFKPYPNIEMQHRVISMAGGKSTGYVTAGVGATYDLIFVDGRFRQDCLKVASLLLSHTGILLLHDSHRPNYMPGVEMFKHLWHSPGLRTMAMGHGRIPQAIESIK